MATCDPVHQEEEPILINELKNESSLQFQAEDPTPETPSQHASEECKVVTKLDHIPSIKPPKVFDNEDSNDSSQCLGEERVSRYNSVLREIPQCPVFEPTLEEFTNISFEDYVQKAESMLDPSIGCFKVST